MLPTLKSKSHRSRLGYLNSVVANLGYNIAQRNFYHYIQSHSKTKLRPRRRTRYDAAHSTPSSVLSTVSSSRLQITTITHSRGQPCTQAILVASTALLVSFTPCGLISITPKHDSAQVEKLHRKILGLNGFSSVSFFFSVMFNSLKCQQAKQTLKRQFYSCYDREKSSN